MKRLLITLGIILAATTCIQAQQWLPGGQGVPIVCAYSSSPPTIASGGFIYAQCDTNGKLITSGGGGGGGGAVTVADGADVTQGSIGDSPWSGTGNGTLDAIMKAIYNAAISLPTGAATATLQTTGNTALTTINTTLGTPMQASGGTVTVTQATAANLKGQMSVVSGGIASGAVASGAYASGAFAAGSGVDGWDVTEGTKADTAWTSGSGSVISLLKTIAGAGASSSITGWAGTTIGTGTIQAFGATEATIGSGFVPAYNVHVTNTNPDITPGDAVTTTTYGAASPTIGVSFLWNGTAYDRQKELGSTGGALVGLNATPSLANGNGVVPTQGGSVLSATNGGYTNLLQGNAVIASGNPLFTQSTASSAIIGKVGIDQTTPGTTNAVAPSTPVGSATLATGQSAGFTTSTLIVAARTGAPGTGRHNVTITNLGTVDTYCGNTGVTTSTGELLVGIKGASITLDSTAAIYCAAGSSSTVSYVETY